VKRINVIGDSHTAALGPALVELLPGDDVTFSSFPGFSTARILSALEARAEVEGDLPPADLTLLSIGGNDFGDRSTNRAALLAWLRENHAGKILWMGPPHAVDAEVDQRHRIQADSQREQMAQLGVDWIDSYPATQSGHRADGVHFTGTGYQTWAKWLAPQITQRLHASTLWIWIWAGVISTAAVVLYRTMRKR
jgi:lysophospholipase L1-like esterase